MRFTKVLVLNVLLVMCVKILIPLQFQVNVNLVNIVQLEVKLKANAKLEPLVQWRAHHPKTFAWVVLLDLIVITKA